MTDLLLYLAKANIIVAICCAGYFLILKRLTYYALNRAYLLFSILLALIFPILNLERFSTAEVKAIPALHALPITWTNYKPVKEFNWDLIAYLLIAISLVLIGRLLMKGWSLYRLTKNSRPASVGHCQVRITAERVNPFSFANRIYIDEVTLRSDDILNILRHEEIHVGQYHTIDILIAELSAIFFWYNPIIWTFKKAIKENVEFQTDSYVLKSGVNHKEYQYSLLNVTLFEGSANASIANNFNFSTLKKRIIMINKKKSPKISLFLYAFLFPTMVLTTFVITNAIASPAADHFALDTGKKAAPVMVTLTPPPGYTDFSDKLIFINGKVATQEQMKKLSLNSIKSVTPLSGDDYVKKYGKKAKNGVLWVMTK